MIRGDCERCCVVGEFNLVILEIRPGVSDSFSSGWEMKLSDFGRGFPARGANFPSSGSTVSASGLAF